MGEATCRLGTPHSKRNPHFFDKPWTQFHTNASNIAVKQRGADIFRQGDRALRFASLESGWVGLYHLFEDGRRQIIDFAVPGDFIGVYLSPGEHYDCTAHAITDSVMLFAENGQLTHLENDPDKTAITRILNYVLRENHRLHHRLTAISALSAEERIAFMLLDLFLRIRKRPPRPGDRIKIPLTQQMIGEAIGLTSIHVNRMLRKLRDHHILSLKENWLTIENPADLVRIAHVDLKSYQCQ